VRTTPKPLLEVAGEPFLIHQLRLLAAHGAREAVMCVGYLGDLIEARIGTERFGIRIRYSFDTPELDGTLGAVQRALPLLGERFLVLNGDTYLPVDYAAAAAAWRASGLPALMVVLHNDGRHERSNVLYDDERVLAYDKRAPTDAMRWVDCGLGGLTATVLEDRAPLGPDLGGLFSELAGDRLLYGFQTDERYYEIGTPSALVETDAFLRARVANGGLRPPPGATSVPRFDAGWLVDGRQPLAFLDYVSEEAHAVNWSEGLEELHEESSRTHFIDVWTRRAMLDRLGVLSQEPVVLDVGCSTGHLLYDLSVQMPHATLIGVDLVGSGLRKAHANAPQARLLQADACALPLQDALVDAVVSANLLEHVPDDVGALAEIQRVLRPGARAVIVVPLGPANYDYYDRYLSHERRYAHGELAGKARQVGLRTLADMCLGAPLYPAFWAVKQRNRRLYGDLRGEALHRRVAQDIARTNDSRLGQVACRIEEALLDRGIRLPFGIRGLTVLERPHGKTMSDRARTPLL
jgi:SAM-dependent methyltransferase/molybdopterin-guanine dinucleotide biosynthesis protein A